MDTVIQLHAYATYQLKRLGCGSRVLGKLNDLLLNCAAECGSVKAMIDAQAAEIGVLKAERDTLQSRLAEATNKPVERVEMETNGSPEALVADVPVIVSSETPNASETVGDGPVIIDDLTRPDG